ncbi:MAG: cytochrome c biogenesis protein CcsA [Bacteroidales bacterium]|nr:cytochrome c biogenesis protein CcsA [Bacteroidales bacterium]
MIWDLFKYFAISAMVLWIISVFVVYVPIFKNKSENIGVFISIIGLIILIVFTGILWYQLQRPPMRTLGETRIWYSLFLPLIGILSYKRWKFKWFFAYSMGLAIVFLCINFLKPENFSKTLMPALQSPWFVPHVIVYMFAYALLGASSIIGFKGLFQINFSKFSSKTIILADNLVFIGFSFLTAGLLFGALWAKEAWGHYWTWDPKETWAFLTWASYLAYMHFSFFTKKKEKTKLWILSLAFIVLMICWFGINYLPAAQNSVHVYSN